MNVARDIYVRKGVFSATYTRKTKDEPMGRFGGGWQWQLGFEASEIRRERGTVIVSLLVASVRVCWGSSARSYEAARREHERRAAKTTAWPTASCCGEPRVDRDVDACYDHAKVCPSCRVNPAERGKECPECAGVPE